MILGRRKKDPLGMNDLREKKEGSTGNEKTGLTGFIQFLGRRKKDPLGMNEWRRKEFWVRSILREKKEGSNS